MVDVLGQRTPADYTIVNKLRIGGILMGNAAIADAHPFKLFELQKKPSMLLGMENLKSFQRVSVDFAAKKIKFLLPAGIAPASDRLAAGERHAPAGSPRGIKLHTIPLALSLSKGCPSSVCQSEKGRASTGSAQAVFFGVCRSDP